MFKAEARAKAHLKQSASRSRTAASGFAARKDSVGQDSGPSRSGERNSLGLKQIPTVEAQSRSRIRPGNCFQCGNASQDIGELNARLFNPNPVQASV